MADYVLQVVSGEEIMTIKATLVVCPNILLDQWEADLQKFFREDALVYCVHSKFESDVFRELLPTLSPSEVPAVKYRDRGLFRGSYDKQVAPLIQGCDVVLVSYDALQDQLSRNGGAGALSNLGFWRVVLDESQAVGNNASKVAMACAQIPRKWAWVTTATPFSDNIDALQGLLAFLGQRPFHEEHVWSRLIKDGYVKQDPVALLRIRTILRSLMLRRLKTDPAIVEQIRVPEMKHEIRFLTLETSEQVGYQAMAKDVMYARERSSRAGNRKWSRKGADGYSKRQEESSRAQHDLAGHFMRTRQMVGNGYIIAGSTHPPRLGTMAAFITSSMSNPNAPLLSQTVIIARTMTKAYAELENAQVESMRKRAVLVAAHEEVAPKGKVPSDLASQHGQEVLTSELRSLASMALLRIPNGERQGLLETELMKAIDISSSAAKLRSAALVAQANAALLGMTGMELDSSVALLKGQPTVRECVVNVLEAIRDATQAGGVLHEEGTKATTDIQRLGVLDVSARDKLHESPARWLRLKRVLEQLWSRKRGKSGDAHNVGGTGAIGQLQKLLHPECAGRTERASVRAGSDEDNESDEEAPGRGHRHQAGTDPLSKAFTAVAAAKKKVERKAHFITYCSSALQQGARSSDRGSTQRECPICLDSPTGAEWAVTPCLHFAHRECLNKWVRTHGDCTECRRPLTFGQLRIWEPATQPAASTSEDEQARVQSLAAVHADLRERFGSKIAALVLEVTRSLEDGASHPHTTHLPSPSPALALTYSQVRLSSSRRGTGCWTWSRMPSRSLSATASKSRSCTAPEGSKSATQTGARPCKTLTSRSSLEGRTSFYWCSASTRLG